MKSELRFTDTNAASDSKGHTDGQKLINIDYIGLGYDVLTGNPHNNLFDPGYKLIKKKP